MSRFLIIALASVVIAQTGRAEDVDKPIRGVVQAGNHDFDVGPDAAYLAKLTSNNSKLQLFVYGTNYQREYLTNDQQGKNYEEVIYFSPVKKARIAVRVDPGFNTPNGPQDYDVVLKRFPLDKNPLLEATGELKNDSREATSKAIEKGFPVKLAKGQLYVAEVTIDQDFINPCLGFRAEKKPEVHSYYSAVGNEGKVARLVYRPTEDLDYVATAGLLDELKPNQVCKFQLKVYQVGKE